MGDIMVGTNSISFILVFLEGLLSFLSPCVIPLIPVYMGYLAGSGKKVNEDGTIVFERKKVFFHTMFFVLGISFSFFILGMSFTALGSFFSSNKLLLTKAGGILIILLGLFQLGIFDFSFLQKERKININITDKKMNPMIALIMGFTFSFAWTPCIGPTLSSVLIMASGATTSVIGNMLVFVYAVGFLIPFLLLGLFTTQVLNFLKSRQKLLKYTIKVGGAILIIMGFMIFTGWMNGVSGYLNSISNNQQNTSQAIEDKSELTNNSDEIVSNNEMTSENQTTEDGNIASVEKDVISAFDFTLMDQYGNMHTLSDYKGKVVFLNFWATWCPPCNKELPDIEELYKEYNLNKDEVVFLGITNPSSEEYPNNQDVGKEEIISFLEDKEYTFPTLFDETGEVLQSYNISAFPTTFMIDKEGNIVGYVPGMMTKDIMVNVINQALNATD
jgi:cytochrome c-type biogenesis protein